MEREIGILADAGEAKLMQFVDFGLIPLGWIERASQALSLHHRVL